MIAALRARRSWGEKLVNRPRGPSVIKAITMRAGAPPPPPPVVHLLARVMAMRRAAMPPGRVSHNATRNSGQREQWEP
jgi:hypothetical protein